MLLPVLVAASSSFLLGGVWYSPVLFVNTWNREMNPPGASSAAKKHGHPAQVYGVALLFAVISAAVFSALLGPNPSLFFALQRAILVGGGLVATSFGINYQFANRKVVVWLIDGGYHVMQFVLYALVFAWWPFLFG